MRKNRGFTLVELLVVISIIGILSSIILPVTGIARRKVRELATKGEIQSLSTACALFKADSGQYPPDMYYSANNMNGVRPAFAAYDFRSQFAHRSLDAQTLDRNDSTKSLVFFLGSTFSVVGKEYGPYMTFSLNKLILLDPGDHVTRWLSFYRQGSVTGLRGIGDDLPNEIYLRCLKDHFDCCYIYDCHDPEGVEIQDQLGATAHNLTSFDLWSTGFDRSPHMPGGEGGSPEPDLGLARTSSEEIQAAKYGNDLTNWTY